MSTRIGKLILLAGLSLVFLPAALSVESDAGEKTKGKIGKQTAKPSGDQFHLTLSTVPYSTDPNSDYVRIYCAPGKKPPKTN